jgi:hypothetical protein
MIRPWMWMAAAVALAVGLVVGPLTLAQAQFPFQPSQPQQPTTPIVPQPPPPSDPRVAQIKAGLEQQGLRVMTVGFMPAKDNQLPRWYAETAANYPRPGYGPVAQQALMIWGVMHGIVKQDPPQTVLIGDQVWTKYSLLFAVQIGTLTQFADAYQKATSNDGRQQAFQVLFRAAQFRVYDNERGQFVDDKDFVNKNFVGG